MAVDPNRVRDLFLSAAELSEPARSAYLAEACVGQPELRAEVERLLYAHAEPDSLLSPHIGLNEAAALAATGAYSPQPEAGTILAERYTLVEEIGEGGMGAVWMAQQSKPVKRRVAIKLIKPGMDSKQVLARFEAERQALALMDHPNIAKVLDGGILPDGRPFFVMELVKGIPITKYCDHQKLTPQQRLELFVPVCQAIQHAHQKGIIHRDIKPSNVLIALYDDKPVPKVIDFGVAKAMGPQLTEHSINTGFGGVVGTPEYMSPEQATFNNLDVDTRSDVYSLGILLYELLAGSPPFNRKELQQAGMLEILRVVREEEPPKPSTKLSSAEALPSLSANRSTEPRKLTGILKNELDWIVMKALEKDRTRRYETANGFASDINRYLAGEPVQAHPPTNAYKLRKFVRRNRGQVIAAGAVLLALVMGIVGTTIGLFEAKKQERLAVASQIAESERAEGEVLAKLDAKEKEKLAVEATELTTERLKQIEMINNTVFDIFSEFDIRKVKQDKDPVEYVLAQKLIAAGRKLDAKAIHDPLVLANLQNRLGRTLQSLGEGPAAIDLLTQALEVRKAKLGVENVDTLVSMNNLATSYQDAGKLDLALPMLEETLKLRKSKLGPKHADTLASMNNLAECYLEVGKFDLAVSLLEETLELQKAKWRGRIQPETLMTMANLAGSYSKAGKLDRAMPLFEETLKLMKAKLGLQHADTLTTMSNLAECYRIGWKLELAVPLLEEAFELQKAKRGPDHPNTLTTMNNLAGAYKEAGKLDKALALFGETFKLRKAKLGTEHPNTLVTMGDLALCYQDAGKLGLALPLYEETLKLRKAKLGTEHPDTLTSMNNLAGGYKESGKLDLSLLLYEETLKLRKVKLGAEHPDTFMSMNNLATGYKDAGMLDLAIPLYNETLKLQKIKLGPEHPDTLLTMHNLASGYQAAGKLDLALPLYEVTLKLQKIKLGPEHPDTLRTMNDLATGYYAARRLDLAIPLYDETLKLHKCIFGADHPDRLTTMSNLALAYKEAGKLELAEQILEETLKLRKAKLGLEHSDTLKTMNDLALTYQAAARWDLAVSILEEKLRLCKVKFGTQHAETLQSMANLGVLYWQINRLDKSIPLFEEELKYQEAKLGRNHPDTLLTLANLGVNYKDAGRLNEAISLLEEAYMVPNKNLSLRLMGGQLLDAYAKTGENSKFTQSLEEQTVELTKVLGKDSPQWANFLSRAGSGLLVLRRWTEAETLLRECLTIRKKIQPDDWSAFNTQSLLGEALLGQKKYTEAEPLLLESHEGMKKREEKVLPQNKFRLREAIELLVKLYEAMGQKDNAIEWRKKLPPEVLPMPRVK